MSLKSRFENRDVLIESLLAQKIIQGDIDVAKAIAEIGELVEFNDGENIIVQGTSDRDMFFILAGKAWVIIKGARLYTRVKTWTVGEMSALNPGIMRSATIQASEPTVVWKISHEQLEQIAQNQPRIWRLLASDLAERLEQRSQFIPAQNARPKMFFICSSEALEIAECIRAGLDYEDASIEIWSDDHIFSPGGYPIEALEKAVNEADFGIAIAQPDDLVRSRDRQSMAPRDNVIFELGFFLSRLGRNRTILLVPRGEDVKLPSDFKGLTPLTYKIAGPDEKLPTALGPTIYRIKQLLKEHGVRDRL